MNRLHSIRTWLTYRWSRVDGPLLVFLLLFLDVKMVVKLLALLLIYCLRPDFRFGIRWKGGRLPWFYLAMPALAVLDGLLYRGMWSGPYLPVLLYGIGLWAMCLFCLHQVRLSIETHDPEVVHRTLMVFFIVNAAWSFAQLGYIMWDSGSFNPYRYQGMNQKYFIGTGDLIKGITLDTSTTNAVFNAIGVIYFLVRRRIGLTVLCMSTLLLTASNCTNLMLLGLLLPMALAWTDRLQKSVILLCVMLFIVFMSQVSPQNDDYATDIVYKILGKTVKAPPSPVHTLSPKEKIAQDYLDSVSAVQYPRAHARAGAPGPATPGIPDLDRPVRPRLPGPSIHSAPFQRLHDTTAGQRALLNFTSREGGAMPRPPGIGGRWPGKVIAFRETLRFLKAHPGRLLTGDGVGNFSSKLAFRSTGLNLYGGYPARLAYIHPDFLANHLAEYCWFFSRDIEVHSVVNTPDSVYNQILGEYGLLGLGVFVWGYVFFFARGLRRKSYGLPLLVLMSGVLAMGYWFEQLSVVVLFEFLLLTDQKKLCTSPAPQS